MIDTKTTMPSVVFKIEDKCYSIPSQYVESIIKMETVTKLPSEPDYVKGIIKYRDRVYKVIDLRKVFGFSAMEDKISSFDELLKSRKQDHLNWLDELENSVKEKRPFNLTTDPTKCAFGKWYYNFKTDDISLKEHLDKFEIPHSSIHKIALQVEKFQKNNEYDKIEQLITKTKENVLASLVKLFDNVTQYYRKSVSELLIILHKDNFRTAFTVDEVLTVEYLREIDKKDFESNLFNQVSSKVVVNLAKRSNDELVLQLSDEALVTADVY